MEGLGFEPVHFDPRDCALIRWICGGGRYLGPWGVDFILCQETLGMRGGQQVGSQSPDGIICLMDSNSPIFPGRVPASF